MQNARPRAFTLVEILVVLAIIAVLAAILLPVFARVRENGRRAACESNLHQIGLALQQYTSDNNGVYPPVLVPLGQKWSDRLQPYLKSSQVFDCSSHSERYPDPPPPGYAIGFGFTGDYNYNYVGINPGKNHMTDDRFEALVPDPEHTSLVGDAGWVDPIDHSPHYAQEVDEKNAAYQFSAHSGGANFVFADGHVKWLSAEQQYRKDWVVEHFGYIKDSQ